jgi:DNA-binding beta-propeller fold protein YncE
MTARMTFDVNGLRARACVCFAIAVVAALVVVVPAVASTHVFSTSFGKPGSGAGQLKLVATATSQVGPQEQVTSGGSGLAVNNETHDVYVADTGNHRIDEFAANGTFLRAWGWGVADGLPSFETCSVTCDAGISGREPGEFESPLFLAIDNDPSSPSQGDVYVADIAAGLISKFNSTGELVASWGNNGVGGSPNGQLNGRHGIPFESLAGIAVSPSGDLYANHPVIPPNAPSHGDVLSFDQSGGFLSEVEILYGARPGGLAVNAAGYIYASNGGSLLQYASTGEQMGQIGPLKSLITGFALDLTNADAYEDQRGDLIEHFAFAGATHVIESGGALCPILDACQATDSFGSGQIEAGAGLAVDPSDETVYGADTAANRIDAFSLFGPYVSTDPASGMTGTAATLNGNIAPTGGGAITACHFEYVDAADYEKAAAEGSPDPYSAGKSIPCAPAAPFSAPTTVSAVITGLQIASDYHFRISATDGNATNFGDDQSFRTRGAEITSESVAEATSTSALLNAEIDPFGEATTYRFEYLTEAAYLANGESFSGPQPAVSAPEGGAAVGSGNEVLEVDYRIQGLLADTNYRYRVVAVDAVLPEGLPGPARAFTTQSTAQAPLLPDDRGWELVSPADKFGALILPLPSAAFYPVQASASGTAVSYAATAPIEPQPLGNSLDPQVLSIRGAVGWASRDIAIPHQQATAASEHGEYRLFSEDLSLAVVQPLRGFDPLLSPEASEQTAYLRGDYASGDTSEPCMEGCYRPLVTSAPGFENVSPGTEFGICEGQTCKRADEQCPPAVSCGPQFKAASPDLSHIVIQSSVALTEGGAAGLYEWYDGHLKFVGQGAVGSENPVSEGTAARHAVSEDGSRIVIKGVSEGLSGLLLRDTAREETVSLGGAHTVFLTASADDSKIFFLNEENKDLDECEIVEVADKLHCDLTDLTPSAGVLAPIAGISEDGAVVYFASNGILENGGVPVAGAVRGTVRGEEGAAGQFTNLYVRQGGVTKLIAVLSGADRSDWGDNGDNDHATPAADGALISLTARVSPNGEWLAFESRRSLTGYDNRDATSGLPDAEVYLYHAAAGSEPATLICASCNPTGARPSGSSSLPGWTSALYQSRYLSDGGRLFFGSTDALVPQDTNKVEDVYEYEPPAASAEAPPNDSCTTASPTFGPSGGCVSLISSGSATEPSSFLDASENGDDVFFLTTAQLSTRDTDDSYDIYDARAGGGEPEPPIGPVECQGDACQSAVVPPEALTPGSLSFSGPGNLVPQLNTNPASKPKAETRAEQLAKALRACRKKLDHNRRAACERKARSRYGNARARKADNKRKVER